MRDRISSVCVLLAVLTIFATVIDWHAEPSTNPEVVSRPGHTSANSESERQKEPSVGIKINRPALIIVLVVLAALILDPIFKRIFPIIFRRDRPLVKIVLFIVGWGIVAAIAEPILRSVTEK